MDNDDITQKLRGTNGWSLFSPKSVNILRIKNIGYRKRLFSFFDRYKPYTLRIDYYPNEKDFENCLFYDFFEIHDCTITKRNR